MRAFQRLLQSTFIALAVLLTGCGGGSGGGSVASGGIGGTGQIASGTITAFGSIFVNGIEFFDVNTANCIINGTDKTGNCLNNLQLGMVVKVAGTNNGTTGNATQITFDNDVDGPVSNLAALAPGDVTRTFTVLNTAVLIDSASTKFFGITFSSLANKEVVNVSGFFDNTGLLHATYVEGKGTVNFGTTQVEVKGVVSATTGGSAGMTGDMFTVNDINGTNNITVTLVAGADLSKMSGGVVSNGDSVEVEGILTSASAISASRVEPQNNTIGTDGDEVSVEGLITNFTNQDNFMVNGQQVNASSATFSPATLMLQLANGIKVDVEGTISGSTIIATGIEARGGDIRIEALASSVSGNTVAVSIGDGTLTIQANGQTQMEDKTGSVSNMNLDSSMLNSFITAGDLVQIRAFVGTGGTLIASELRRDSAINASKDILQGPIDSFAPDSSVTVLGITFFSDNNTSFIDATESPVPLSSTFYGMLSTGLTIKIRDDFTADGVAEEMSLED